jgi:DNA-binding XRE family transcriptional regulator
MDELAQVFSFERRNLTTSQRALVAAKIVDMKVGGDRRSDHCANLHNDTTSQSDAAKKLNVSRRSVQSADMKVGYNQHKKEGAQNCATSQSQAAEKLNASAL